MTSKSEGDQAPRALRVESLAGRRAPKKKQFIPVASDVLLAERPLDFDVYVLARDGRTLEVLFHEGEHVSDAVRESIKSEAFPRHCYVCGDKKDALLQYQEGVVSEILEDESVAIDHKCSLVRDLTTLLSQEIFEDPRRDNILRQQRHVRRVVDFAIREPLALRGLTALTHHDYYTYTHSVNVGLYALSIAVVHYKGRLESHDLHEIAAGFFLHDVGKCRVRPGIINKADSLTEEEWEEMRKHPSFGNQILREEDCLSHEISVIVMQHHERADGRGYPRGLRGDDIHPYARVCKVADAYDALTTNRAYKRASTPFRALQTMRHDMHTQFDPEVFKTFVLMKKKRDGGSSS